MKKRDRVDIMPQTAIEKIVQRYAAGLEAGARVHAGDFVRIHPKHVMTHDNTGAVIPKFRSIFNSETGKSPVLPAIADPRQPVFAMDHDVQNTSPENLGKYAKIEAFAREHGIDYYPPGRGIAHQVMVEEGYVTPGSLVVGSDSHSNLYGAVAAVGTPVVRTDAAAIWATGETWWQIPELARVELTGALTPGATGKDVIVTLCGYFNSDEVLNCAVEFAGAGVASLSVEERMTIANMTTEWGALVGMFPFDERLRDFLNELAHEYEDSAQHKTSTIGTGVSPVIPRYTRADVDRWWAERASIEPDTGAFYSRELTLDLASVSPHVSGPEDVKTMTPIAEFERSPLPINKAYLMSCVNARLEDLAAAAAVVRGRRVAPSVEFYLAPASSRVKEDAERLGYWGDLIAAGAIELPPGCGACIGLGRGTLEPGEIGISATNRNFKGRMGSREAKCYLASPAVVAASAIAGRVCGPEALHIGTGWTHAPSADPVPRVRGECRFNTRPKRGQSTIAIREDFPERIPGRVILLPKDDLNTDGIYGKDVTYRDDITFEQQGAHAMLNYDPAFQRIARPGDIIVAGRNFGTGSSREQAATALASFGIRCVVAESFSQTYARNAYNNGFICIECPGLVDSLMLRLADERAAGAATIPGPDLTLDFAASVARTSDGEFDFPPLSPVAQELVSMGGAEAVIRARLADAGRDI